MNRLCSTGCGRNAHARGMCRACYDKELKAENPAYAERQRAQSATWQKGDSGKRYRKRNPQRYTPEQKRVNQDNHRRRTYGLEPDQYDALVLRAGGLCEVCKEARELVVDHCHSTGKVRGLLCRRCNLGLGLFYDNKTTLARLTAYLVGEVK